MDNSNSNSMQKLSIFEQIQKLQKKKRGKSYEEWLGSGTISDLCFLFLFNTFNHNCYITYNLYLYMDIQHEEQDAINGLINCISKGIDAIVILLTIYTQKDNTGHQNILIYRKKYNTIEHFEPHGSYFMGDIERKAHIIINKKLTEFVEKLNSQLRQSKQIQFISSQLVCPRQYGFQGIENIYGYFYTTKDEESRGYCSAWSLFITYFVLKYPNISTGNLVQFILNKIYAINDDEEDVARYLLNVIRSFVTKLHKTLIKYLSGIYDTPVTIRNLNTGFIEHTYQPIDIYTDLLIIIDIKKYLINNPSLNTVDDYKNYLEAKSINNNNNIIRHLFLFEKIKQTPFYISPISENSYDINESFIDEEDPFMAELLKQNPIEQEDPFMAELLKQNPIEEGRELTDEDFEKMWKYLDEDTDTDTDESKVKDNNDKKLSTPRIKRIRSKRKSIRKNGVTKKKTVRRKLRTYTTTNTKSNTKSKFKSPR
jgi:hypothetical protein